MNISATYRLVKSAIEIGRLGYVQARLKVQAYAKREGISEAEAWTRLREEAGRRGDELVARFSARMAGAEQAARRLAPVLGVGPFVALHLLSRPQRPSLTVVK